MDEFSVPVGRGHRCDELREKRGPIAASRAGLQAAMKNDPSGFSPSRDASKHTGFENSVCDKTQMVSGSSRVPPCSFGSVSSPYAS